MNDTIQLIVEKKALLLDMNGTFMFGEDRFDQSEDFSVYYSTIGGKLPGLKVNNVVRSMYEYLSEKYTNEKYRHSFPSVEQALSATSDETYEDDEIQRIVATFAHHELGNISPAYVNTLRNLRQRFALGVVIDIWSPKAFWLNAFEHAGLSDLFSALSFSSDHGMVKPSPKPFERVLKQLNVINSEAFVVGDSPRRDLGGAQNAGIDCILVGGAKDPNAIGCFASLLEVCRELESTDLIEPGNRPNPLHKRLGA